jgi:hypothetical protein
VHRVSSVGYRIVFSGTATGSLVSTAQDMQANLAMRQSRCKSKEEEEDVYKKVVYEDRETQKLFKSPKLS